MTDAQPKPYLYDDNGREEIVIPHNCEAKYRYWQGGQSVITTLRELGAKPDTIARYLREDLGYDEDKSA